MEAKLVKHVSVILVHVVMSCLSLIHDLGHYLAYTLIFIFALGFKTFRLSCSVARPIPKQGFTRFLIFMLP